MKSVRKQHIDSGQRFEACDRFVIRLSFSSSTMTNMTALKNFDVKVRAQQMGLFETPVVYSELSGAEELMEQLESAIRLQLKNTSGVSRSNIGSWHSDTDMLDWGGPAAQQLADTAVSVAKRMSHFIGGSADDLDWSVRMWANVTPKGGLNHIHVHPGNLWAAVLYLDMGDTANGESVGGNFYLEDPRFPMCTMRENALRMMGIDGKPQQIEVDFKLARGNLIVFPAWLRHGVRQYNGPNERISIAMNIDASRRQD